MINLEFQFSVTVIVNVSLISVLMKASLKRAMNSELMLSMQLF